MNDAIIIVLGCIAATYLWFSAQRSSDVEDIRSRSFHMSTFVWFFALIFVIAAVFTTFKLAFNILF